MNCAICGFDNTADTRFCKKCGAALTTAAAAPAAPPPPAPQPAAAARPAPAAPPPPPAPMAKGTASDAPRGSRTPIIPLVIIFAILGITTFGVYQSISLLTAGLGASMAEAPKMGDMMKDMMKEATQPPEPGTGPGGQAMPPGGTAPTEPAKAEEPPKEPEKAPEPPPMPMAQPAPPPAAPPPAPKAAPAPAPAPKAAPAPPPAPPKAAPPTKSAQAVIPAPAQVAAPPVDRWAQMSDDMARCSREDVFRKLGCELRVRARYCEGYWGKVPQCPERPSSGQ